jgi:CRP-like cAMP-binding protein/rhodanese-related sulfurtransferase
MDGLKSQNLSALVNKTSISAIKSGRSIFKVGDDESRTIYLVSGSVELQSEDGAATVVEAGSMDARFALSAQLPRQSTAKALEDVEYLSIDTDLLDVMLTWDQTGSYEVSDLRGTLETEAEEDGQDWMTTLLQTSAFHRIPPANIQAIFIRMQQLDFQMGDPVIKQGDDGDFFYAIIRGQCSVVRETPLNKQGIKLAELGVGDTFGEEALISESKRNATVTMMTDGSVMRLAKEDFQTLLNEPLLDWVDYSDALELAKEGAVWLDVRLPSEYENFHETGAINIPLYFIRLKLNTLDKDKTYIVCCDTSRRSSAGAYILGERGFKTRVLQGGLNTRESE